MLISRQSKNRKTRAIALIATLMVVALVAMLLGAFFEANRTQMAVFKGSQGEEQLQRSAQSISAYLQSRMEENSTWPKSVSGTKVPNDIPDVVKISRIDEISSTLNTHEVWGYYYPDRVGFRARVHNNLTSDTKLSPQNATQEYEFVPPRSVRIFLETFHSDEPNAVKLPSNSRVKAQVVTMRQAAQIDSTLVSSKGIFLDSAELAFTSRDEIRNQIRSLEDVEFSNIDSLGFGHTQASAPGTVWARGKITSDGQSIFDVMASLNPGSETIPSADPTNPTTVTKELSTGRFMENAVGEFGAPSFSISDVKDLKSSEGADRADVTLFEGVWEFTRVPVTYDPSWPGGDSSEAHLDILVHRSSTATNSTVHKVYAEVEWSASSFTINSSNLNITSDKVTKLSSWSGKYHLPVKGANGGVDLANPNSPILDFKNKSITLASDVNYVAEGNFGIGTNIVDTDVVTPTWKKPQLILANGWESGGWGTDKSDQRAYLEVEGDFSIDGKLDGVGNIVAHNNISFELNNGSIAADTKTDFALYAGKDITIKGSNEHPDLKMLGLVYAKGSVILDFTDDAITPIAPYISGPNKPTLNQYPASSAAQKKGHFTIEGAVVAETGGMVVRGLNRANFIYNPDYLDNLFNVDEHTMRLETISWWPVR